MMTLWSSFVRVVFAVEFAESRLSKALGTVLGDASLCISDFVIATIWSSNLLCQLNHFSKDPKAKRQRRWDDVADLEFRLHDDRFGYALVGSNLKRDVECQGVLRVRQRWVHRFTKWAALQRLMGGSVDFTANPHLIQRLIVRAASFSGFFACKFPNEKPSPKLYLALTHDPIHHAPQILRVC